MLPWRVVGEVASLRLPDGGPHPKAGAFAEAQASTLARKIAAQLAGGKTARYSGINACFVKLNYHESKAERRKQ